MAKSFFKNLLHFITNSDNSGKPDNVSAQQAIAIQKDFINDLERDKSDTLSPPYTEIAKQLNGKPEVFHAAVHYLIQIAQNEDKYASPILSILKHFSQRKNISPEDIKFLQFQIKKIEK